MNELVLAMLVMWFVFFLFFAAIGIYEWMKKVLHRFVVMTSSEYRNFFANKMRRTFYNEDRAIAYCKKISSEGLYRSWYVWDASKGEKIFDLSRD